MRWLAGWFLLAAMARGRTSTFELMSGGGSAGGRASGGSGGGGAGGRSGGGVTGGGVTGGGVTGGGVTGGGVAGGGVTGGGVTGGGVAGGGVTGGGSTGACPERMQTLAQVRSALVGTWRGSWTANYQTMPVQVVITFEATGHYSGRALSPNSLAFAYGTDEDLPAKVYSVDHIKANGDASGFITIGWKTGSTITTTEGTLDSLRFCDQDQRLDFVFSPEWSSHIPHRYRLTRE